MPSIAEISAMPRGTRSRGNSSRMIPKASGKIAPPAPWITRATISTSMLVASAASSVPTARTTSGDEHALLAEHVAQAADDRRQDRGAQQVGGEDPRDRGGRRVQVVLDLRQRRRDERLQDRERDAASASTAKVRL